MTQAYQHVNQIYPGQIKCHVTMLSEDHLAIPLMLNGAARYRNLSPGATQWSGVNALKDLHWSMFKMMQAYQVNQIHPGEIICHMTTLEEGRPAIPWMLNEAARGASYLSGIIVIDDWRLVYLGRNQLTASLLRPTSTLYCYCSQANYYSYLARVLTLAVKAIHNISIWYSTINNYRRVILC